MSSSDKAVADSFPHPDLGPVDTLSFPILKEIEEKLLQNCASVPSTLGGGNHGHSGLLLPDTTYFRETTHHYVRPPFPGVVPAIPQGTNALAERNLRADHASELKEFQTVTAVENAIRNFFTSTIPDQYLEPLKQSITGISAVPIRTILATLYKNHGKLNSNDLAVARKSALEPWDVTQPVQVMLNRIKKSADILDFAEEPYSEKQMIRIAYDAVLKAGIFSKSLKDWRRKPAVDKTWPNFKTFLAEEYNDYLEDESAEDGNPYRASNAANDEIMSALQHIMANMTSYQENITTLNSANAVLKSSNTSLESSLLSLSEKVKALTSKVQILEGNKNPSDTRSFPRNQKRKKYCYTCGSQFHHFSSNCPIAPPGHKKEATWKLKLGGSEADHTQQE